jgi:hypothetical protein
MSLYVSHIVACAHVAFRGREQQLPGETAGGEVGDPQRSGGRDISRGQGRAVPDIGCSGLQFAESRSQREVVAMTIGS